MQQKYFVSLNLTIFCLRLVHVFMFCYQHDIIICTYKYILNIQLLCFVHKPICSLIIIGKNVNLILKLISKNIQRCDNVKMLTRNRKIELSQLNARAKIINLQCFSYSPNPLMGSWAQQGTIHFLF